MIGSSALLRTDTCCYNILVISHAYNRGYGTGYAIPRLGIYIIRYHLMTYVSHLKPEGLTSSPLRGLTHDSTWLANREPSSGLGPTDYDPPSYGDAASAPLEGGEPRSQSNLDM